MAQVEKPSRPDYPVTTILRNNPGMFRDCWVEKDVNGEWMVVIRQIKFDADGVPLMSKVIRLTHAEAEAMVQLIHDRR